MNSFVNTVKTIGLLGTLTGLFVLVGGAVGGTTGMVVAFGLALVMNIGTWWFSDRLALKMSGARPLDAAAAPELYTLTDHLAQRAGLPMPALYVIDSETPNAFATGRDPHHAAVAVTSGIVRLLTREELAGVIAHELAHIKHRDTLISAVAASVAGAIAMLADMVMWGMLLGGLGGNDEEDDGPVGMVGGLLTVLLAPIVATIIQLSISRSREYLADAGGAQILGNPLALASALEKLEWAAGRLPLETRPAVAHLYVVNPLSGAGIAQLFRTHPLTAERVKRLRALAGRAAELR